jgi:hypothetical protein
MEEEKYLDTMYACEVHIPVRPNFLRHVSTAHLLRFLGVLSLSVKDDDDGDSDTVSFTTSAFGSILMAIKEKKKRINTNVRETYILTFNLHNSPSGECLSKGVFIN